MSKPDVAEIPFASPSNSEEPWLTLYLFPCGHGDTILLRFPGARWALVDCYLPKGDGTRDRFFKFVEDNGIVRLEWIIQTHPDFDHFHGMTSVLEYFTTPPRSVGIWCDCGLTTQQIKGLIDWSVTSSTEYEILQNKLDDLYDENAIQFLQLADNAESMWPKGYKDRIAIVPVAPQAGRKRQVDRKGIRDLLVDPKAKLEANDLSVVLAVSLASEPNSVNFLLPGDAGGDSLAAAMDVFKRRAVSAVDGPFLVLKMPHHGSIRSHVDRLCKARDSGHPECVVAISAGTRRALPDSEVMRAYLKEHWRVLLTTARVGRQPKSRPSSLSNRARGIPVNTTQHLIEVSWSPRKGLQWGPPEAAVEVGQLGLYGTAASQRAT